MSGAASSAPRAPLSCDSICYAVSTPRGLGEYAVSTPRKSCQARPGGRGCRRCRSRCACAAPRARGSRTARACAMRNAQHLSRTTATAVCGERSQRNGDAAIAQHTGARPPGTSKPGPRAAPSGRASTGARIVSVDARASQANHAERRAREDPKGRAAPTSIQIERKRRRDLCVCERPGGAHR